MGDRYLLDLLAVCQRSGQTIEVGGWQYRARSSGGYSSGAPNHVMAHHTASNPGSDGWDDVNYITYNADAAPLANLYLNRGGLVWVCAGGATNTNGSGVDPCGHLPDDTMNTAAIGIEAANTGTGEVWPDVQLDRYTRLVADLCDAYGIPVDRCHGHAEYAPDRKIDPAGPPRYATGSATWNMDEFRADVAPAPTPPTPGDPDMAVRLVIHDARNDGVYVADATGKSWIDDGNASAQLAYRIMEAQGKRPNYERPPDPLPTSLSLTGGVAIDGFHYVVVTSADPSFIASYGPFLGSRRPAGLDDYGR